MVSDMEINTEQPQYNFSSLSLADLIALENWRDKYTQVCI